LEIKIYLIGGLSGFDFARKNLDVDVLIEGMG
jgi:hypothetical protein